MTDEKLRQLDAVIEEVREQVLSEGLEDEPAPSRFARAQGRSRA